MVTSNVGRLWRDKLKLEIDDIKETLAVGNIPSVEVYRFHVGLIAGLRRSIEVMDEVEGEH